MMTWFEAGVYCEETYEMPLSTTEGYFVCPDCGEPIFECDWKDHDWSKCPICDFDFMEG